MIPPDAETVLVQDDWLRRMARQLVRDPELADDLVQDAWVAGLERRRTQRSERPWLAGVLRNRGRAFFRARTRRLAREARVAPTDDAPPTDDVVAQLQLRERASHAMLELDEPYRTAVYLTFVQGLGVREAAKHEGVAPSTMSERVREGIARLRRRIDDAYDGDRRAWVTALVPLARPKGLAALGAGGAVMLASAVLVTGLVAGGLTLALEGNGPGPVEAPASTVGGVRRASAELESDPRLAGVTLRDAPRESLAAAEPAPSGMTSAASTAAQEPEAGVSGRFLLPDGAPAAGATWRLRGHAANDDRKKEHGLPDDWSDPTGTLDADGRIDLRFDPPQAYQFILSVEFEDHVAERWRWGRILPAEIKDIGTAELRPCGEVTGRVVDAQGEPLVGTSWSVYAKEIDRKDPSGRQPAGVRTETDLSDATFTVGPLPEGVVRIKVYDRAFGWSREHSVVVVAGQSVARDIVLEEAAAAANAITVGLQVETYDSLFGSSPVTVSLIAEDGTRRTATQAPGWVGTVVFDDVGPGAFRVELVDPRLEPWSRDGVVAGERIGVRLRGTSGLLLDVRDESGSAVDVYSVELEFEGALRMPRRFHPVDGTTPLPEGRLMGLVPADYLVTVRSSDGAASTRVPGLAAGETRPVSLTVRSSTIARGVVRHHDGSPASGVTVRLVEPAEVDDGPNAFVLNPQSSTSEPERVRVELAQSTTALDGTFELPMEIRGVALVMVGVGSEPRSESGRFDTTVGSAPIDLELIVERGSRLEGRVLAPDGVELVGKSVLLWRPGQHGSNPAKGEIDADGRFELGPVASGHARVVVLHGGGWGMTSSGELLGGVEVGGIQLVDGETITATFDYPAQAPATIQIDLAPSELGSEPVTAVLQRRAGGSPRIVAGPADDLDPVTLEPDRYELWFGGDGWIAHAPAVDPEAGQALDLALDLDLTSRLVRFIIDGEPIAKKRIRIASAPREIRLSDPATDVDGWLDLRLGRGTYSFWIADPDDLARATRNATVTWPLPDGVEDIVFD